MPRGRHRHSPPLHRILPPSVIAGVPLVCAGGVWLSGDPLVLRCVTAAAAAAAVVGSVVMRRWDRLAGKQVADLTRGAASERWRHEEAVAELEGDLEESRELRVKLEGKLRAKRSELAALRNEHAALLRRYANAETERASALEGRRRLAIEAAVPTRALPPAQASAPAQAPSPAEPGSGGTPSGPPAGAALYLRANAALDRLARRPEPPAAAEESDSRGKSRAASGHYTVPVAAAVAPAAPVRKVPQGGFDFFGTSGDDAQAQAGTEAAAEAETAAEAGPETRAAAEPDEDLADVIGEEALAEQEVIDLTAHDETEQIDVNDLRSALRA
ncbi:hypothetical protein [Streptomyces sp. NPDC049813]|uniref:hypothetical protein n=1 Tax=Streptomyces sp. NPDC049813 TaxID=3365597 RepID=UPI00378F3DF5